MLAAGCDQLLGGGGDVGVGGVSADAEADGAGRLLAGEAERGEHERLRSAAGVADGGCGEGQLRGRGHELVGAGVGEGEAEVAGQAVGQLPVDLQPGDVGGELSEWPVAVGADAGGVGRALGGGDWDTGHLGQVCVEAVDVPCCGWRV